MKKILLALFAVTLLFTSCQHDYEQEASAIQIENSQYTRELNTLKSTLESSSEEEKATALASFFSEKTKFELDTKYSGEYDYFKLCSDGQVLYWGMSGDQVTDTDTSGVIADILVPKGYQGLIAVVKTTSHTNYGQYCYPDYEQTATGEAWGMPIYTHSGCYVGFYCKPIGQGLYMAQSVWSVPGHTTTACAETLKDFFELYDLYGYDMTCANLSSQYSR